MSALSRRPPWLEPVLASVAALVIAGVAIWVIYAQARESEISGVRSELGNLARSAATLVDPVEHAALRDPAQTGSPAHLAALARLVRFHRAVPSLFYVYTGVLDSAGGVHFVLDTQHIVKHARDAAPPANVWQLYHDAPDAMREALQHGVFTSSAAPYRDRWGVFMSGYAPFFDSSGRIAGVVGVDLSLAAFEARLRPVRHKMYIALGVSSALSILLGCAMWRQQLATVEAERRAREAAEARAVADEKDRRLRETHAALDDHCAVAVAAPDGTLITVNQRLCQLSGFRREELVGHTLQLLDSGHRHGAFFAELDRVVRSGRVWHGVIRHRRKDGAHYWVDTTVFPFRDAAGVVREFIWIQTDITELVHAREAAEAAARAKSEFLATMSHEIRTPLNGVIGFAHLLADTPLDDQQRDFARTIITSGESLLAIVNDILDFSKLEARRAELERRPLSLRQLVEDVLELVSAPARKKDLELVYTLAPDVPEAIYGDEVRLRQILLNLCGNAVKFTPRGHIEVFVEVAPPASPPATAVSLVPALIVHVRDAGPGIAPERRDRLFKAFSQVDASVTRTHGGTGLGLAIVERLVTLMDGVVGVESAVGRGSDFWFALPLQPADSSEVVVAAVTLPQPEIAQRLRDRRILVVDDHEANRLLFVRLLAPYGATVFTAASGDEALVLAAREACDAAVLDYMMPGLDGIGLALRLRELPAWRTTPLVLLSSMLPAQIALPPGLFHATAAKPVRNLSLLTLLVRAIHRDLYPAPRTEPAPSDSGAFARRHPLSILVVDDNEVNLKVITLMLGSLGYAPIVVDHARTALAKLRDHAFDVALVDVMMPEISGLELTRRLRAGEAGELNRHVAVIALTAAVLEEDRVAAATAGMTDFLMKPIRRDELMAKLAAIKPARPA